jgi:cytosine/adenosine deaminase-related metal-dependent hydrolase
VFDGRGTAPAPADVAVEDGRIVDVGPRLDGDVSVDATGRTLLPGLFDCHVHVTLGHVDHWRHVQEPFSLQFYWAARNLEATVRAGITSVRDAGGADLGVKRALELGWIVGPRIQLSLTMLSQTGGHGGGWMPSGVVIPLLGNGFASWSRWAPTSSRSPPPAASCLLGTIRATRSSPPRSSRCS